MVVSDYMMQHVKVVLTIQDYKTMENVNQTIVLMEELRRTENVKNMMDVTNLNKLGYLMGLALVVPNIQSLNLVETVHQMIALLSKL